MRQKVESTLPKWGFVVEIRPKQWQRSLFSILPGLLLTSSLAIVAFALKWLPIPFLSPFMAAILIGMILRNSVRIPTFFQPGITFSLKRLLRIAIALLGLQLSVAQLQQVGMSGLVLITITLVATFGFTYCLGRYFNIRKKLICLIAAGTSICGASAIVATGTVIDSSDEDTTYAVAIVTLFGTLSMLLYPLVLPLLHLTPEAFGIWCGASIHEVAQAIAVAFQTSSISGELASISKLSRVLWLAPITLCMSYWIHQNKPSQMTRSKPIIPWFIVGFIGLILLNSLHLIPTHLKFIIASVNQFLLTIAMIAMGLETRLFNLRKIGLKPLYLGAFAWIFISILSLGFVMLLD